MRDFTKLRVWQRSHALALEIYRATRVFPSEERFGLTQQVRRSAASIPTNVAEGAGRRTKSDFARFIDVACGSANETLYHLMLSKDLLLLDSGTFDVLAGQTIEVRKMLTSFAQVLRSRSGERD